MAIEFPSLAYPIVQAPMAGGPSTPALAAAVSDAGGLGFLAAGYRTAEQLRAEIEQTRALTAAPFGVNLFYVTETEVDAAALAAYAEALAPWADRYGVELGATRYDDDDLAAKLEVVKEAEVPIVSFTFGFPTPAVVETLHNAGASVWATVTEPLEARAVDAGGAEALICQGIEAGGHRGTFIDADGQGELGLLALLRLVAAVSELPLVAAGGIADGLGVAAALAAGARAAQLGTAFMRCPEAGTSAPHRDALGRAGETALTRAFSGRRARGIRNAFMDEHGDDAPAAYPEVHHLTAPLRAAARAAGDAEAVNLWAGQAYRLSEDRPAAELVELFGAQARTALLRAQALAG